MEGKKYFGTTFQGIRSANMARLPQFRDAKGNICHKEPDGSDWTLTDWMTAVAGETGELANFIKKVRRGDFTIDEARRDIAFEAADIVIYLDILCANAGIDLQEAIMTKFNLTSEKVKSDVRLVI